MDKQVTYQKAMIDSEEENEIHEGKLLCFLCNDQKIISHKSG